MVRPEAGPWPPPGRLPKVLSVRTTCCVTQGAGAVHRVKVPQNVHWQPLSTSSTLAKAGCCSLLAMWLFRLKGPLLWVSQSGPNNSLPSPARFCCSRLNLEIWWIPSPARNVPGRKQCTQQSTQRPRNDSQPGPSHASPQRQVHHSSQVTEGGGGAQLKVTSLALLQSFPRNHSRSHTLAPGRNLCLAAAYSHGGVQIGINSTDKVKSLC